MRRLFVPLAIALFCIYCFWLSFDSLHAPLPRPEEPPALFSNQSRQDLRLIYVKAIEEAKESLDLIMFNLSDPAILGAITQRIDQKIATNIYFDASETDRLFAQLPAICLHPVHVDGLMHQKILIVDRDLVLMGSANMTHSSLCMHDNLVVGMRSAKIAEFLLQHAPFTPGCLRTMVGGQDVEIWLLPDPRGTTLSALKQHLRQAQKSLKIALFTFTHPSLSDEVIAAQNRGVEVTVVVDMHSALGASARAIEHLKQNNIRVLMSQGVQLLHHKFVWIDDEILLSGSANWTKSAFNKNSDCMVALHQMTEGQKKFMKGLWHRIEAEASQ